MSQVFAIGDRVDGLYDGNNDDMWYPGRIQRVYSGESLAKSYEVLYDDGELETNVPLQYLRVHVSGTICVGTRVFGRYAGADEWYPGKILEVQDNGLYTIEYDDTEIERDVPLEYIKETLAGSTEEPVLKDEIMSNNLVDQDTSQAEPDQMQQETASDRDDIIKADNVEVENSACEPERTGNIAVLDYSSPVIESPQIPARQQPSSPLEQANHSVSISPTPDIRHTTNTTDEYAAISESIQLLGKRLGDAISTKSILSNLVKQMRSYPQVTAQLVHEGDGERLVVDALKFHDSHAVIQCYCFVLLRRLCFLCAKSTHYFLRNGVIDLVMLAMKKFAEDAILQASACGALAVFTRVHAGLTMLLERNVSQLVLATTIYHKTYSVHTRQVYYYACEVLLELCELRDRITMDMLCGDHFNEAGLADISPISLLLFLLRQGLSFDDKKACCAVGSLLMCLSANNRHAAELILQLNGLPELSTMMTKYPTEPGIQKYSASASKQIALCSVHHSPKTKVKEAGMEISQESGSLTDLQRGHHASTSSQHNGTGRISCTSGTSVKRKGAPIANYSPFPAYPRGTTSASYSDPQSFSKFASPIGKAPYLPSTMNSFAGASSTAMMMPQRNSLVILDGANGSGQMFASSNVPPNERKQSMKEERQSLLFETYGFHPAPNDPADVRMHGIKRKQLRTHIVSAESSWATPVKSPQELMRDEMLANPSTSNPLTSRSNMFRHDGYNRTPRSYLSVQSNLDSGGDQDPQQMLHQQLSPPANQQQTRKKKSKTSSYSSSSQSGFQIKIENESQLHIFKEMQSPYMSPTQTKTIHSKNSKRFTKPGVKKPSRTYQSSPAKRAIQNYSNAPGESLNAYATQLFNGDLDPMAGGQTSRMSLLESDELQERERLSFAEKLHKMIDKAKLSLAGNISVLEDTSRSTRSISFKHGTDSVRKTSRSTRDASSTTAPGEAHSKTIRITQNIVPEQTQKESSGIASVPATGGVASTTPSASVKVTHEAKKISNGKPTLFASKRSPAVNSSSHVQPKVSSQSTATSTAMRTGKIDTTRPTAAPKPTQKSTVHARSNVSGSSTTAAPDTVVAAAVIDTAQSPTVVPAENDGENDSSSKAVNNPAIVEGAEAAKTDELLTSVAGETVGIESSAASSEQVLNEESSSIMPTQEETANVSTNNNNILTSFALPANVSQPDAMERIGMSEGSPDALHSQQDGIEDEAAPNEAMAIDDSTIPTVVTTRSDAHEDTLSEPTADTALPEATATNRSNINPNEDSQAESSAVSRDAITNNDEITRATEIENANSLSSEPFAPEEPTEISALTAADDMYADEYNDFDDEGDDTDQMEPPEITEDVNPAFNSERMNISFEDVTALSEDAVLSADEGQPMMTLENLDTNQNPLDNTEYKAEDIMLHPSTALEGASFVDTLNNFENVEITRQIDDTVAAEETSNSVDGAQIFGEINESDREIGGMSDETSVAGTDLAVNNSEHIASSLLAFGDIQTEPELIDKSMGAKTDGTQDESPHDDNATVVEGTEGLQQASPAASIPADLLVDISANCTEDEMKNQEPEADQASNDNEMIDKLASVDTSDEKEGNADEGDQNSISSSFLLDPVDAVAIAIQKPDIDRPYTSNTEAESYGEDEFDMDSARDGVMYEQAPIETADDDVSTTEICDPEKLPREMDGQEEPKQFDDGIIDATISSVEADKFIPDYNQNGVDVGEPISADGSNAESIEAVADSTFVIDGVTNSTDVADNLEPISSVDVVADSILQVPPEPVPLEDASSVMVDKSRDTTIDGVEIVSAIAEVEVEAEKQNCVMNGDDINEYPDGDDYGEGEFEDANDDVDNVAADTEKAKISTDPLSSFEGAVASDMTNDTDDLTSEKQYNSLSDEAQQASTASDNNIQDRDPLTQTSQERPSNEVHKSSKSIHNVDTAIDDNAFLLEVEQFSEDNGGPFDQVSQELENEKTTSSDTGEEFAKESVNYPEKPSNEDDQTEQVLNIELLSGGNEVTVSSHELMAADEFSSEFQTIMDKPDTFVEHEVRDDLAPMQLANDYSNDDAFESDENDGDRAEPEMPLSPPVDGNHDISTENNESSHGSVVEDEQASATQDELDGDGTDATTAEPRDASEIQSDLAQLEAELAVNVEASTILSDQNERSSISDIVSSNDQASTPTIETTAGDSTDNHDPESPDIIINNIDPVSNAEDAVEQDDTVSSERPSSFEIEAFAADVATNAEAESATATPRMDVLENDSSYAANSAVEPIVAGTSELIEDEHRLLEDHSNMISDEAFVPDRQMNAEIEVTDSEIMKQVSEEESVITAESELAYHFEEATNVNESDSLLTPIAIDTNDNASEATDSEMVIDSHYSEGDSHDVVEQDFIADDEAAQALSDSLHTDEKSAKEELSTVVHNVSDGINDIDQGSEVDGLTLEGVPSIANTVSETFNVSQVASQPVDIPPASDYEDDSYSEDVSKSEEYIKVGGTAGDSVDAPVIEPVNSSLEHVETKDPFQSDVEDGHPNGDAAGELKEHDRIQDPLESINELIAQNKKEGNSFIEDASIFDKQPSSGDAQLNTLAQDISINGIRTDTTEPDASVDTELENNSETKESQPIEQSDNVVIEGDDTGMEMVDTDVVDDTTIHENDFQTEQPPVQSEASIVEPVDAPAVLENEDIQVTAPEASSVEFLVTRATAEASEPIADHLQLDADAVDAELTVNTDEVAPDEAVVIVSTEPTPATPNEDAYDEFITDASDTETTPPEKMPAQAVIVTTGKSDVPPSATTGDQPHHDTDAEVYEDFDADVEPLAQEPSKAQETVVVADDDDEYEDFEKDEATEPLRLPAEPTLHESQALVMPEREDEEPNYNDDEDVDYNEFEDNIETAPSEKAEISTAPSPATPSTVGSVSPTPREEADDYIPDLTTSQHPTTPATNSGEDMEEDDYITDNDFHGDAEGTSQYASVVTTPIQSVNQSKDDVAEEENEYDNEYDDFDE